MISGLHNRRALPRGELRQSRKYNDQAFRTVGARGTLGKRRGKLIGDNDLSHILNLTTGDHRLSRAARCA